jgi:hypothetical protein
MSIECEKQLAAEAAAKLVENGTTVGLGTGSTVAFLLQELARRRLSLRCVASSVRAAEVVRELGLRVAPFDRLDWLDLVIDGADQTAPRRLVGQRRRRRAPDGPTTARHRNNRRDARLRMDGFGVDIDSIRCSNR